MNTTTSSKPKRPQGEGVHDIVSFSHCIVLRTVASDATTFAGNRRSFAINMKQIAKQQRVAAAAT